MVELDSPQGLAGISLVDGRSLADGNGTGVSSEAVRKGDVHDVAVRVRKPDSQGDTELLVHLDGEQLLQWKGKASQLSLPEEYKLNAPARWAWMHRVAKCASSNCV